MRSLETKNLNNSEELHLLQADDAQPWNNVKWFVAEKAIRKGFHLFRLAMVGGRKGDVNLQQQQQMEGGNWKPHQKMFKCF